MERPKKKRADDEEKSEKKKKKRGGDRSVLFEESDGHVLSETARKFTTRQTSASTFRGAAAAAAVPVAPAPVLPTTPAGESPLWGLLAEQVGSPFELKMCNVVAIRAHTESRSSNGFAVSG